MKQTAVEWLYERLERMIPRSALYDIDKREYFKQAKEIEYWQNKYFYDTAFHQGRCTDNNKTESFEYYNKTFKS
jgi:hypothetical protein